MVARLTFLLILAVPALATGQTQIMGTITDGQGPVIGANVYLKGTYDGASTDVNGYFSFHTGEKGSHILIISSVAHQTVEIEINLYGEKLEINQKLRVLINELSAVSITAGTMEANDEKRSVVFRPMDVVTTSGALGNIISALNTLPGTATISNDGRLFVRGGDASETAIFLDGLRAGDAYQSTTAGVATRSRFNPFILKGTFFSTGGYSAEYGQALSSALVLNTVDMPLRTQTDISLLSVGGDITQTLAGKNQSFTGSLSYTDLKPYYKMVSQNFNWVRAPQYFRGEAYYRHKTYDGSILKVYYTHQFSGLEMWQNQPGKEGRGQYIQLNNQYNLVNLNFRKIVGEKWLLEGGASFSSNYDQPHIDSLKYKRENDLLHLKIKVSHFINDRFTMSLGAEGFTTKYKEEIVTDVLKHEYRQNLGAVFGEGNYYFNEKLVFRAGFRGEYDDLKENSSFSPRISAAYKTSENGQISMAYGQFYQMAENEQLVYNPELDQAKATHYILNYQLATSGRTIRGEIFYKDYYKLVTSEEMYTNGGYGKAAGFDLFYRDRVTISNLDYWLTYSFVDSKRKYAGYAHQVQPDFAPRHNVSFVTKYWLGALKSQIGSSFSFNDGYAYDNPNIEGEQESRTKAFSNLSLNWSYLPRPNIIIHAEVTNVLGQENIYGYQYALQPGPNGDYASMPDLMSAKRFFFIGFLITFSKDKSANQLNNL